MKSRIIHTEYTSYLLLSYIYYLAGRQTVLPIKLPTTVILITCVHTHIVIPCIHVVIVSAIRDLTDIGIVKGALYSSVGAPTMWLSITLSDSDAAAAVVAFNYVASLVAIPLSLFILCGHPSKPETKVLVTVVSAVAPYAIGVYHAKRHGSTKRSATEARAYALVLLYVECCQYFDNAGGVMKVFDLFAIILLVFTCLLTSTTACWAYARCGLIDGEHSRTIALCSMSKSIEFASWRSQCAISGASMMLAALPARALVLAVISDGERASSPAPE